MGRAKPFKWNGCLQTKKMKDINDFRDKYWKKVIKLN